MKKEVKGLAVTEYNGVEVLDAKKAEIALTRYNTAVAGCNKSAWALAKCLHSTVTSADFKRTFRSINEYAKLINVNKSSISRMVNAYERKAFIDANNVPLLTVANVVETLKVDEGDLNTFCETYEIDEKSTAKYVRECVKAWCEVENGDEEATGEEATGEEADGEATGNEAGVVVEMSLIIETDGIQTVLLTDAEKIKTVLDFIENLK